MGVCALGAAGRMQLAPKDFISGSLVSRLVIRNQVVRDTESPLP
jgi:hypothetical protein